MFRKGKKEKKKKQKKGVSKLARFSGYQVNGGRQKRKNERKGERKAFITDLGHTSSKDKN